MAGSRSAAEDQETFGYATDKDPTYPGKASQEARDKEEYGEATDKDPTYPGKINKIPDKKKGNN
jgi:hypothetical protein